MHQETNSAQEQDIQTYLDTLRFLNESTDDYLYLTDFQTDRIYFSGPIYEKYNLNLLEKNIAARKTGRILSMIGTCLRFRKIWIRSKAEPF